MAGKKHKILAMYMTLAEITTHNRSSIDPMQLILLWMEDAFIFLDQESVISPVISDLKEMEENGINCPDRNIVRTTVVAITVNNLGSHCIGGFTENVNKSRYFIDIAS